MLRDLTVQNYRCFEDFQLGGLERVNLFVGNNNSGKTSLLEAIYLKKININSPEKFIPWNSLSLSQVNNCIFLNQNRKELNILGDMWNNIYLTDKEDKVVQALKIIEPDLQRIGFFLQDQYNIVRLKVSRYNHPIPLSSMGEGMYRILTLAMSLVSAENGVLLVDEIETGLYYKAQTDMWRLILETAKELNVQVFATTHSWDCIAAFEEALEPIKSSVIGKLFRLDGKYGELRAVEYNAEDLEIAVEESIEVR
jgi:AAA15 family ATPase/GTPase